MDIPLIVRLQGTKEEEAKKLIKESGMAIFPFDGLDEVGACNQLLRLRLTDQMLNLISALSGCCQSC
jgi:succinyl-CoA synthetase beta subunit